MLQAVDRICLLGRLLLCRYQLPVILHMVKLGQIAALQQTSTACHMIKLAAKDHRPIILHMTQLGQVLPLHQASTACHSSHGQIWTSCVPAADISCLSLST